jgi:hypothetical protein
VIRGWVTRPDRQFEYGTVLFQTSAGSKVRPGPSHAGQLVEQTRMQAERVDVSLALAVANFRLEHAGEMAACDVCSTEFATLRECARFSAKENAAPLPERPTGFRQTPDGRLP